MRLLRHSEKKAQEKERVYSKIDFPVLAPGLFYRIRGCRMSLRRFQRRIECHRGFTLIELCLTVVLLSILAIAAIPSFRNSGAAECRSAASKIASDITYMRRLSMARHNNYYLTFNAATNSYAAYYYNPATPLVSTAITDPLTQQNFSVNFSTLPGMTGVDITSANINGNAIIAFNSDGYPLDMSGTMLNSAASIVVSKGGITRTVRIEAYSGEVSIQ